MNLHLTRLMSDADATIGILRLEGPASPVFCFTLEDEHRTRKVAEKTRIPAGRYRIRARDAGGMVGRYRRRFPWHRGMLHLQAVPGFEWIYLHVGNTHEDTAGCILVAYGARLDSVTLQASAQAYEKLYRAAIDQAETGELWIAVEDRDR